MAATPTGSESACTLRSLRTAREDLGRNRGDGTERLGVVSELVESDLPSP
jgi:hypothetical protein